jgi:hypothetical protein
MTASYRLRATSATCHLICRACGQIVAVNGREIRDWAGSFAAGAGFTLTGYTVDLSGLCPAHSGQYRTSPSAPAGVEGAYGAVPGGGQAHAGSVLGDGGDVVFQAPPGSGGPRASRPRGRGEDGAVAGLPLRGGGSAATPARRFVTRTRA